MSGGTVGPVDEAQLDALVGRYEWFTPARILRVLQTGRSDRRVSIAAVSRLLPLGRFTVDREALCALSPADLIDRFLKEGGHRIVAEEGYLAFAPPTPRASSVMWKFCALRWLAALKSA